MESRQNLIPRLLAIIAIVLLGLAFVGSVSSQENRDIYTWTDEEGVRHFSAYPPQGIPYEIVEGLSGVRVTPPPPPTEAQEANEEMPQIPEMRETAPDPEVVAARCEQARTNLNLLRQDRPAILRSEDGDPTPLEGERRQEMIEETEAFIDQWC